MRYVSAGPSSQLRKYIPFVDYFRHFQWDEFIELNFVSQWISALSEHHWYDQQSTIALLELCTSFLFSLFPSSFFDCSRTYDNSSLTTFLCTYSTQSISYILHFFCFYILHFFCFYTLHFFLHSTLFLFLLTSLFLSLHSTLFLFLHSTLFLFLHSTRMNFSFSISCSIYFLHLYFFFLFHLSFYFSYFYAYFYFTDHSYIPVDYGLVCCHHSTIHVGI